MNVNVWQVTAVGIIGVFTILFILAEIVRQLGRVFTKVEASQKAEKAATTPVPQKPSTASRPDNTNTEQMDIAIITTLMYEQGHNKNLTITKVN